MTEENDRFEGFINEVLECFAQIHLEFIKLHKTNKHLHKELKKLRKEVEQHRLRTGDY